MTAPRRRRPWSLRRRLILGTTALATLAVLVSQLIGFVVLRGWLLDRVDQQLAEFVPPPAAFLDAVETARREQFPPQDPPGRLPSDFRVLFYDASGQRSSLALGTAERPGPRLARTSARLGLPDGRPRTVPAVSGAGNWRVLSHPGPEGVTAVVALPLDTVDGATSKLLWLNGLLLAVTLAGLVAIGGWVVRLGLLPLTRIGHTAQRIGAGELGLRLRETNPRTEIGRLGHVLNTMLDHLQQALRESTASEARLRRFVADAGHELRTPLTVVQGFAELALRHADRPAREQRETHELIAQNARRMSLLVDDLLLLATVDHEPERTPVPVDLTALAADAVSSLSLRGREHTIRTGPWPAGPEDGGTWQSVVTLGDGDRLRQVVTNLLSNALTHTPPGTHIRVRTGRTGSAPGGTAGDGRVHVGSAPAFPPGTPLCVVEVADDGPGLAPEHAERVFERFYRADPARSRARGGSGLGLSIAAAIAHGHGGLVELDTAAGRGAAFRLLVPAADVDPEAADRRGGPPSTGPARGAGGRPACTVTRPGGRDPRREASFPAV
ncbi:sensor histidine kinase [Streptomyces sp. NPDC060194]|uniref:sensor histidine kinase n=1 Tax=Streptomyces sp. NPDC060194 TaxID=3347069 RepID=UPI00365F29AC